MNVKSAQSVDLGGLPIGEPITARNGAFLTTLKAFAPANFVIQ